MADIFLARSSVGDVLGTPSSRGVVERIPNGELREMVIDFSGIDGLASERACHLGGMNALVVDLG
jgi:hypothetical protein